MKLYRIWALLVKYWYVSTSSVERMFDMFYWPLLATIVFGFTTLYFNDVGDIPNIIVFLLGGILFWQLIERIQQDVSIFTLEDFWSRNIANLYSTPVRSSEIFTAITLTGLIRACGTFAAIYAVAFFAYKFNVFANGIKPLLFVIPLIFFGWAIGTFVSALVFKFGIRIQVLAWSLAFLFQPFGAVFYPIETLPKWMQVVAHGTPLMYTFEGFREAYLGAFPWDKFWIAMGIGLLYTVIGFCVFMYSIHKARKTGLLTKY